MGRGPTWLLLENVPFMLQLGRGGAMGYVTYRLEEAGFRWAYRVIDNRAFGLPQRRLRVIILASRSEDPTEVLFHDNEVEPDPADPEGVACGFYWTEGIRGLGWAVDAVPTLKGGSTIGIPSAPAIRMPDGSIVTPALQDAERLQGFDADWTEPALRETPRVGHRWKLVGNAVSVPMATWVGRRLGDPRPYAGGHDERFLRNGAWPRAAWNDGSDVRVSRVSSWPVRQPYRHLVEFLRFEPNPLSARAAQGFLNRAARSSLRFPPGLLDDVRVHLESMREPSLFAA
jgi:DNA (cytosine-5)-methyltransferase 1